MTLRDQLLVERIRHRIANRRPAPEGIAEARAIYGRTYARWWKEWMDRCLLNAFKIGEFRP